MRRIIFGATLAAAGMIVPITSFAASPSATFLLRRGAVVDSGKGAAYVSRPSGSIDAIDLASGRTLWTSTEAALPLGVDQDLLIGQVEEKQSTERFRIAVLNTAGGSKVSETTIALPAGVRALAEDELGRSFLATAEREGSLFLISWFYSDTEVRGERDDDEAPSTHLFAGSARINPQTGKVVNASGGPVTEAPGRWSTYGAPPQQPWQAGGVSARTEGGRGGPLVLKRTEPASGRPLPDQALSNRAIVNMASFDQRHLLVSERVGQGGPDDPEYRWVVFALDSGQRVTELRRDVSAAPFFLFNDGIVLVSQPRWFLRGSVRVDEPLQLLAFRLSTAVPTWSVEFRDFSYHGQLPARRRK